MEKVSVTVACSFLSRLKGLLFSQPLPPARGLLIQPCYSVHTFFMGYTIDVLFLDKQGYVIKIVPQLRPWRAASCRKAYQTLELFSGEAARLNIQPGDKLQDFSELR